jgi:hypothetical protein
METVKAVTVGGRLVFAIRVWKIGNTFADHPTFGKVPNIEYLHTDVDDDYPREPNGDIDWSLPGPAIDISNAQVFTEPVEDMIRGDLGMKRSPIQSTPAAAKGSMGDRRGES